MKKHLLPLLWVLCVIMVQSKNLNATTKTDTEKPQFNTQDLTNHDKDSKATRAADIYVDKDATTGGNNGTSWADAYTDLQSALAAAASGNHIWVAAGTYKPTATASRDIYFEIPNGVELYGGFAGAETDTSQRTDYGAGGANETILSGDIGTVNDTTDNSYHVIFIEDASTTIKLNGLTISHGCADNFLSIIQHERKGGGIYYQGTENQDSYLDISDCIFSENDAYTGGSVYTTTQLGLITTTFTNCTFNNNSATNSGGAVHCIGKDDGIDYDFINVSHFNSCTFTNNTAGYYGGGGARIQYGCETYFTDCEFTLNHAVNINTDTDGGGAIHVTSYGTESVFSLTSCDINGNSSTAMGGGILYRPGNGETNLSITDSKINSNTSTKSGGGISILLDGNESHDYYSASISKTEIRGNLSNENGGGLYAQYWSTLSSLSINNCLITGNKQTDNTDADGGGGGIYIYSENDNTNSLDIINSTICGNYAANRQAQGGGGGIFIYDNDNLSTDIKNTSIYGNSNYTTYSDIRCPADNTPFTNCIIHMGTIDLTGTNIIYLDPRFTDPIDDVQNDAPTTDGDYSLLAISPLINAGTTTDAPADDINGNARPLPAGTMPDIGAYEYSQMETTAPSGSGTSGDPYQISSLANLAWMQYRFWEHDDYYNLTADIDASATADWNDGYGFRSIGYAGDHANGYPGKFSGTFDGAGYIIDGLYINDLLKSNVGLFGFVNGANIMDFGLTNVSIIGGGSTGSAIGILLNSTASDIYATGNVNGTSNVGGLCGNAYVDIDDLGSITDCYADVDVIANDDYSGGFIGINTNCHISKSYALGDVNSTGKYVGGFVGKNDVRSLVTDCFYIGTVTATNQSIATYAGGFVGYNSNSADVSRCYSVADVNSTGTDDYGFCGANGCNPGLNSCVWNTDLEPLGVGAGFEGDASGKTTAEMKTEKTYTNMDWDFDDTWSISSDINNGFPYLQDIDAPASLYTWTGNESSKWSNAANWNPEQVPGENDDVLIPHTSEDPQVHQYPLNINTAKCKNMTIEMGAELIITDGNAFSITGILEQEEGRPSPGYININDGGSLIIEGQADGNILFNKELTTGKYHYISSPIDYSSTASTFSNLNLGLVAGDQFYRWEENYSYNGNIGNWVDILNGEDGTGSNTLMDDEVFQQAKGYAISYNSSSETISLMGAPYDRSMSISMTRTENSTREGWNLLGNPFTAALAANNNASATNLVSVNTANLNVAKAGIYVWNEQANYEGNRNDYLVISDLETASYVAPGQAFMVCAATHGASFEIEKGMQQHATATFYKSTDDIARFYLQVKGPEKDLNDILIGFVEGKTKGLDPSYDVAKVKGNPNIALYSYLIEDYNNQEFAHQALPAFEEDYDVQIGLDAWIEGKYTFRTKEMQNIPEHIEIELLDKETGIRTNMRDVAEYTFHISNPESLTDRFVLTFKAATGIAEGQNTDLFSAYSVGSKIYIQNPEALSADVRIMDISGKTIMEFELNANTLQEMETNLHTGVYLIQITNGSNAYNKQILIQ